MFFFPATGDAVDEMTTLVTSSTASPGIVFAGPARNAREPRKGLPAKLFRPIPR
jgi:hypothetical protein